MTSQNRRSLGAGSRQLVVMQHLVCGKRGRLCGGLPCWSSPQLQYWRGQGLQLLTRRLRYPVGPVELQSCGMHPPWRCCRATGRCCTGRGDSTGAGAEAEPCCGEWPLSTTHQPQLVPVGSCRFCVIVSDQD